MSDAPVLGGIHRMENLDTADDFTKKHTPYVECTREGDVCVVEMAVGHYAPHPNLPDHFFEYFDLYANGVSIARYSLSAVAVSPRITATLTLDPGTKLTVLASCNLHGVWAADITT